MTNTDNKNNIPLCPSCPGESSTTGKLKRWWSFTILYVIVLYATLPLGRPVITWMRQNFTHSQQHVIVYSLFGAAALALLIYIFSLRKKLSPLAYVCFIILARLYYLEFTTLIKYPEERLHFLEYGVLACLLHKAFSLSFKGVRPYIYAAILGALLGWGDEGVQHLTKYLPAVFQFLGIENVNPNTFRRYFSWGDVKINAIGVLYGLAFLATVVRNVKQDFQDCLSGKS